MTIEKQVVSLDLARRLKELGVKPESIFVWDLDAATPRIAMNNGSYRANRDVAAFTVAELGEMLHEHELVINSFSTSLGGEPHEWCVTLSNRIEHIAASTKKHAAGVTEIYHHDHIEIENTEADARAKMLIYLLENKLIVPNGLTTEVEDIG